MATGRNVNYIFPKDAVMHYNLLFNATRKFRNIPIHEGSNYKGPWIENLFIERFLSKPLEYFNGLIPLFVQWSDYHLFQKKNIKNKFNRSVNERDLFIEIRSFLRTNVIYITVSQANLGLQVFKDCCHNVLIMSAGGVGNIPIPLIKGNLEYQPIAENFPFFDISFLGSLNHSKDRKYLISLFEKQVKDLKLNKKLKIKIGKSNQWINETFFILVIFNTQ
jgi:hypothetical protein